MRFERMNDTNVKYLVFLEFLDEAELFLKKYRQAIQAAPPEFKIITFHPTVTAFLRRNQIEVLECFHFAPTESHRRILLKADECAQEIYANCRLTDAQGVDAIYVEEALLHSLFHMFSQWFYQIEVVTSAIRQFAPSEIICAGELTPRVVRSPWIERKERFIAAIASQTAAANGIKFNLIPHRINYNFALASCTENIKDFVRGNIFMFLQVLLRPKRKFIAAPAKGYNIDGVLRDLSQEFPDHDVVALDMPLDKGWKMFVAQWQGKTDAVCKFFPANPDRKVPLSADFIEQKKRFCRELFKIFERRCCAEGVLFVQWMKDKYQFVFEPDIIDKTYFRSVNLNRFFDRYRPEFIVAQYARGFSAVMGLIARNKNIPALLITHGSFTAIHDKYSRIDWQQNAFGMVNTAYEYLAVQTPLLKDFLADMPVQSKLVVTGPLVFGQKIARNEAAIESLRRQYAPRGEKIFLHAGTPKFRRGQRLINYETLDEYVDSIISLIQSVDRLDGVHLIVRYREIDGLSVEELKSLLPVSAKYSVASGGNFADYLALADLLISYSSTTIEEALQNNIPVLLFNPYQRYIHIKGVEISSENQPGEPSAVYNVNSSEGLEPALRWIADHHLNQPKTVLAELFEPYQFKPSETMSLKDFILKKNLQHSLR